MVRSFVETSLGTPGNAGPRPRHVDSPIVEGEVAAADGELLVAVVVTPYPVAVAVASIVAIVRPKQGAAPGRAPIVVLEPVRGGFAEVLGTGQRMGERAGHDHCENDDESDFLHWTDSSSRSRAAKHLAP